MLNAGGNDRCLSDHEGNCLTLHVCTHQSSVCVVVFEERDHCGCNGNHHTGADINVVNALTVDLDDLVTVTAGDTLIDKASVFVTRLGRRSDNVIILNICGHVLDLIGDAAGALLHLLEGGDKEAVLIGTGIGCKVRDKADVGTFRSLDGAQTTVMAVMYISDIEGGSFSGQTAGAECGHTALMGKLGQGVCLVHELGQR